MDGARRTPTQERSEASRTALLEAAFELVAERGWAGASHRAIASRAGVSPGLISYYFASLDDLARAAADDFYRRRAEEYQAATDRAASSGATLSEVIDAIAAAVGSAPVIGVLAHMELSINAHRHPGLRTALARQHQALADGVQELLERFGIPDAASVGRSMVLLLEGAQLRRLAEGSSSAEDLRAGLRHLLLGPAARSAP